VVRRGAFGDIAYIEQHAYAVAAKIWARLMVSTAVKWWGEKGEEGGDRRGGGANGRRRKRYSGSTSGMTTFYSRDFWVGLNLFSPATSG